MPYFNNINKRCQEGSFTKKSVGGTESNSVVRSGANNSSHFSRSILQVACNLDDYERLDDAKNRRLFLIGEIGSVEECGDPYAINSMCGDIVEKIMRYNREDFILPTEKREPIKLYINSPGGNEAEGYALIAAIETSKTPSILLT